MVTVFRYGDVELKQVCWLEVTATIPLSELNPGKYNVSLKVRLKQDVVGWDKLPIQIMAKIGKKGKYKWQTNFLDIIEHPDRKFLLSLDEIVVTIAHLKDKNDIVYFGLYEVWRGRWKGGLVLEEAILRKLYSPFTKQAE
ncbi:Phloem protein 2-like a9 [Thalictrum thalictroides]|uniref:Phloem protein 2-like a9 n=1 Tax=Thalictrum thalictroides TaxID=46969 RepID=A0A7J6WYL6_THATH|nr:Phloem protein 2-like a9 [Thalictrum thalictroides]